MTDFYVWGDLNPQTSPEDGPCIEIGEVAFGLDVTLSNENDENVQQIAEVAKATGRPLALYRLEFVREFGDTDA